MTVGRTTPSPAGAVPPPTAAPALLLDDARGIRSAIHEPDTGRPCVHLLEDLPQKTLFSRPAVANLNFQPRICPPPSPCIASRHGDILTVAFDSLKPVTNTSHRPARTRHRWSYQLHPVDDTVVLGHLLDGVT